MARAVSNGRYKTVKQEGLTNASGEVIFPAAGVADFFSITATPVGGATGSLAFSVQVHEDSEFEPLIDPVLQTQQTIDLATGTESFIVRTYAEAFKVTPTAVVGEYNIIIQQGTE